MPLLSSKPSLRNLSTKRSESPVVVKPPYIPKHVGNPLPVDTVPFVVPETFQFFDNANNSWTNQTSLSFTTSSNDYAYLHLEVVCSEICSSATSKSSFSHYGTGVIHGIGKSRTNSTLSLSSTSSVSSYGSSTAQTLYYPKIVILTWILYAGKLSWKSHGTIFKYLWSSHSVRYCSYH